MIAGLITAMLLGSISASLGQLGRAKASCKERLDAYLRADAALSAIRSDIVAVIRSDDLLYTRVLLVDNVVSSPIGDLERDELVIFNTRIRPIRNMDFNGEGSEYETHYRVDDAGVPILWQRRDPFPDEYPLAGGMAVPLVEYVLSLQVEAYDGEQWHDDWDSDETGLPVALRVTVEASGARPNHDSYEAISAPLRTVVAIDRILPPADQVQFSEEELALLDERVLIDPALAGGDGSGEDTTGDGGAADPGGRNTSGTGGSGGATPNRGGRDRGEGGGGGQVRPEGGDGLVRPPRSGNRTGSGSGAVRPGNG
jgi:hypothetical protein